MTKFIDRAVILLAATVTYITAGAVGLSAAAGEIADAAPVGNETATTWLVRGVAWLVAAATIVRRVTPVAEASRGILPPDNGDWTK
jgi:hypothetical protein